MSYEEVLALGFHISYEQFLELATIEEKGKPVTEIVLRVLSIIESQSNKSEKQ